MSQWALSAIVNALRRILGTYFDHVEEGIELDLWSGQNALASLVLEAWHPGNLGCGTGSDGSEWLSSVNWSSRSNGAAAGKTATLVHAAHMR